MPKLGQLLVERGWADPDAVRAALRTQRTTGGRLGTCLLENNAVSEDVLLEALAVQHRVPAAGLEDLKEIPPETLALLPAKVAIRCRAVPFRAFGTRVDVAMVDPRDLNSRDEIAFAIGRRVEPHVTSEVRLAEALDRHYGEPCIQRLDTLAERLNRSRYLWSQDDAGTAPGEPAAGLAGPEAALWKSPAPTLPGSTMSARDATRAADVERPERPERPEPPAAPATGSATASADAAPPAREPGATTRPKTAKKPQSISLSEEERRLLFADRAGGEPGEREESVPLTFAEALARIGRSQTPEEIGDLLIAFLGRMFERVALFKVHRERIEGWRGTGDTLDGACIAAYSADFQSPSVFLNLRQGGSFYLGPLPPMPAHRRLARCLGDQLPKECLLLPVRIRGRLVTVIYLDRGQGGLKKLDLEGLTGLAVATAEAYERCILRKKKE